MIKVGLLALVEAEPAHADEVGKLLTDAVTLAERESGTTVWFAFRIDETSFGVFDAFGDDEARQTHLHGEIASALLGSTALLTREPDIRPVDVLAWKVPVAG